MGEEKIKNLSFKRKYSIVFFFKTFGIALTFLIQIFIAKTLNITEFGIYTYVISWLTLISLFATFGFEQLLTKTVASFKSKNKELELKKLVNSSFLSVSIISLVLMLLIYLTINILDGYTNKNIIDVFMIGGVFIPLMAFLRVNSGILKGYKLPLHDTFIIDFIKPFSFMLGVFIYFTVTNQLSATVVILVMIGSLLVTNLISYTITYKIHHSSSQYFTQKTSFVSKRKFIQAISLSKTALPFIALSMIVQIERNTDILMLGALNKVENAGIYSIASRITGLLLIIHMTLNTIAGAKFSELYSLNKRKELQLLVTKLVKISAFVSFFAVIFIFLFSENLLALFGGEFVKGELALKILVMAQFIKTIVGPALLITMMTGHQKQGVKILATGALLNIILNLIFIPLWGMNGAAIATSISIIFWCIWLSIYLKKTLQINTTIFSH